MAYKKEAIEDLANRVLQECNINTFPVDPIYIAGLYGYTVFGIKFLDPNVSALIDFNTKEIKVSNSDHVLRQRFSIAHELGHLCLRHNNLNGGVVSYRDSTSSLGFDINEIEANFFAASLLMPREMVLNIWHSNYNIDILCNYFQVSRTAVVFRLNYLGIMV